MLIHQIIRLRYNDTRTLENELDRIFPNQEWSLAVNQPLLASHFLHPP